MILKNTGTLWLASSIICLASAALNATAPQWTMIPGDSKLTFTATQNGAPVSGEFNSFTAAINADPVDLKSSMIDIVVDMNSITASYPELKDTLISSDWFNVKMFPKAEFKATNFKKTADNNYQAMGTLTIRDKLVPVTLTFTADLVDPKKGLVTGSTTIKRTAFGVGQGDWASTDEIKDDVTVNFKITATKQ
jgi:polyisoprenoid-binding protein YceI